MGSVKDLTEAVRPVNGLLAVLGVWIGSAVEGNDPFDIDRALILLSLSAFFLLSGGNILNDLNDRRIDSIVHPERAIVSGRISTGTARYSFGLMWIVSILLASLASYSSGQLSILIVLILAMILMFTYEYRSKDLGFAGNLSVAMLTGLPFVFGSLIRGGPGWEIICISVMAALVNLSREIFKDMEDMKGDTGSRRTLPLTAGENISRTISSISVFTGVLLSLIPGFFPEINPGYLFLVILADFIFIFSLFGRDPGRSRGILKAGMAVSFIAFFMLSLS